MGQKEQLIITIQVEAEYLDTEEGEDLDLVKERENIVGEFVKDLENRCLFVKDMAGETQTVIRPQQIWCIPISKGKAI